MGSGVLQVRALALVAAARILLPRRGTAETLRRLAPRRPAPEIDPELALTAVRRARKVVGGACLPQAVALAALVHRGDTEPVLVVGCQRYPNRTWGAHAWVRVDGRVLDPDPCGEHADLAWYQALNDWQPGSPANPAAEGVPGSAGSATEG